MGNVITHKSHRLTFTADEISFAALLTFSHSQTTITQMAHVT